MRRAEPDPEKARQAAMAWQPGRAVRNEHEPRPPRHRPRRPIPIRARIVWADTGDEQWIDTYADGWDGHLVYVDATPIRPGFDRNHVWLHADDVQRR